MKIESLTPKLSQKFKSIEKTVKLLLSRKRKFCESREIIMRTMYDAVEVLQSDRFEYPKPVLVSLKTLLPTINHDLFECMQLMGLDHVIQVQEDTYSVIYFFNFAAAILLGIIQLAIGFVLFNTGIMGTQIAAAMFEFEGIADIVYALSTLKSGVFRWKDYRNHKITSVVFTASLIGTQLQLIRLAKYCKFDQVLKILLPSRSVATVAPLSSFAKSFSGHIVSKCGRAITIAGVSMGVDHVVTQLNTLPEGLANVLREKLNCED